MDADVVEVPRTQVLAHRVRTHGLDRRAADVRVLALWDLGVQDTPSGSAAVALAARLPAAKEPDLADGRSWAAAWSVRGAPHVHRQGDLAAFAAATWPADSDDAAARLAGTGATLRKAGHDVLDLLRAAAEAMAEVVTAEMPKGEASTEVTRLVPDPLREPCRSCGTVHISDQVMRLAALPGGVRLVPGARAATLAPIGGWDGVPDAQAGAADVVSAYLRLHGPARPKDVAAYLQTTAAAAKAAWPADDLAEVTVDGTAAWLPADELDALLAAPAPRLTRLLPRGDAWLLARDRDVTVPDRARQKALWPVLGAPGALLVDGEVAGTWRTRASGRRLDLTVSPFAALPRRARRDLDDEAERVVAARGLQDLRLAID